ncbi:MAG: isoprenylcysteine carboxylmethyltransferase family protein [Candidatus Hydrogenedentes bacterium]|nr:isoprenylcysteine carboxylmethyltransferase family protein [Candidatus Hydrogenedentota bacterium]
MKKILVFAYGLMAYLAFLVTILYAIGFVGNVIVPKSIDSPAADPFWFAMAVNLGLLTLFAVQHSVMARPAFKRWWNQYVPEAAERSTYVLFASLALLLLFWQWRPLGGVIWNVEDPAARVTIYALFASGWTLVFTSTCLINHFDLFGLRQVWLHLRGREDTQLRFATPVLYRFVRHPLYVGFMLAFWSTPTMTVTHLFFALVTTAYIVIAVQLEERDLIEMHGARYATYRKQVPMFIPRIMTRKRAEQTAEV